MSRGTSASSTSSGRETISDRFLRRGPPTSFSSSPEDGPGDDVTLLPPPLDPPPSPPGLPPCLGDLYVNTSSSGPTSPGLGPFDPIEISGPRWTSSSNDADPPTFPLNLPPSGVDPSDYVPKVEENPGGADYEDASSSGNGGGPSDTSSFPTNAELPVQEGS